MRTSRLPRLTLEDLDEPARLAAKIDQLLMTDKLVRNGASRIRRLPGRLRDAVNEEGFQVYLSLEEAVNARSSRAVDIVASWAFGEGTRARRKCHPREGAKIRW